MKEASTQKQEMKGIMQSGACTPWHKAKLVLPK